MSQEQDVNWHCNSVGSKYSVNSNKSIDRVDWAKVKQSVEAYGIPEGIAPSQIFDMTGVITWRTVLWVYEECDLPVYDLTGVNLFVFPENVILNASEKNGKDFFVKKVGRKGCWIGFAHSNHFFNNCWFCNFGKDFCNAVECPPLVACALGNLENIKVTAGLNATRICEDEGIAENMNLAMVGGGRGAIDRSKHRLTISTDEDSICVADRYHGSSCNILCLTHGGVGDGPGKEYKEDRTEHTDMDDGVRSYHLFPDSVDCDFGYPKCVPQTDHK